VQGYGAAAAAVHLTVGRTARTFMLVCSPVEAYYRCRRVAGDPRMPYRRTELLALTALARLNGRIGRHYVVLSEHLAATVRNHGGAHLPVSVVPVYGVDTERFAPTSEPRRAIKASLGLPSDRPVIFFSSRIAPEKDAGTLLAAAGRLVRDGMPIHILHRSGGYRAFAAAAEMAGLAGHYSATDAAHPDALPRDYHAADLCVQASRAEGLGFSPLEALACGTPVVAAAVGGLQETVIPGVTGWSYPPGNVDALAGAIRDALADPDEGTRRALNGRRLVVERFERGHVFDRLAELLA
jgi:glycosyltransferase involved in cell wall biosynthesis